MDKIEITPALLRNAGFRESVLDTAFRFDREVGPHTEIAIDLAYNKRSCTYTIEAYEYYKNRMCDRCRFQDLSTTSEVNRILRLFRYSENLPILPEENQSPGD